MRHAKRGVKQTGSCVWWALLRRDDVGARWREANAPPEPCQTMRTSPTALAHQMRTVTCQTATATEQRRPKLVCPARTPCRFCALSEVLHARHCRRTAAHKRTDKRDAARRTGTPFGAGGAKFAEAVAKLLAPGGDAPVRVLPRCMRRSPHPADVSTLPRSRPAPSQAPSKQAAAVTQGRARAAPVPILSRSRTVTKRVEDEHAERLRLRAVRRHKREVRLLSKRCVWHSVQLLTHSVLPPFRS
jgi:hypothetical protein